MDKQTTIGKWTKNDTASLSKRLFYATGYSFPSTINSLKNILNKLTAIKNLNADINTVTIDDLKFIKKFIEEIILKNNLKELILKFLKLSKLGRNGCNLIINYLFEIFNSKSLDKLEEEKLQYLRTVIDFFSENELFDADNSELFKINLTNANNKNKLPIKSYEEPVLPIETESRSPTFGTGGAGPVSREYILNELERRKINDEIKKLLNDYDIEDPDEYLWTSDSNPISQLKIIKKLLNSKKINEEEINKLERMSIIISNKYHVDIERLKEKFPLLVDRITVAINIIEDNYKYLSGGYISKKSKTLKKSKKSKTLNKSKKSKTLKKKLKKSKKSKTLKKKLKKSKKCK